MEDKPSPGSDQEKKSRAREERQTSADSFFSRWLRRRQLPLTELFPEENKEDDEENEPDEDDDKEKKPKEKKLPRLLQRIFGKIAEVIPSGEPAQEAGKEPEEKVTDNALQTTSPNEVEVSLREAPPDQITPAEQDETEVSLQNDPSELQRKQKAVLPNSTPRQPQQLENNLHIPQEIQPQTPDTLPVASENRGSGESSPTPEVRYVPDVRGEKAAAAFFVTEEILSRYRDRKQKRAIRSLEKGQKNAQETVKNLSQETQEIRINQAQQAEAWRRAFEYQQTPPASEQPRIIEQQTVPEARPIPPETQPRPIIERVSANEAEKKEAPPIPPPLERMIVPKVKPEAVLHKIEEAAEKNVPLEDYYERRHEVKDTPTQSTAAILQGMGLSAIAPQPTQPARQAVPPIYDYGVSPKSQLPAAHPQMYRQAAKSGFWGAMAILILAAIAYFVF